MYELIFLLPNDEKIVCMIETPLYELVYCNEIPLYFMTQEDAYLLIDDCIGYALEKLITLLEKAMNNQLEPDKSISQDLGFMWNRLLHGDKDLTYENKFWVGQRYLLWSTASNVNPNLETWLFNGSEGNIIIEVTENYLWHHKDPEQGENYSTYEEFMENYKPFLIRTIPHDVARQWIAQAEFLLQTIEENEERHRNEGVKLPFLVQLKSRKIIPG